MTRLQRDASGSRTRHDPPLTRTARANPQLNCDPMRITKKFAGASCIGKQVFQPCDPLPENEVSGALVNPLSHATIHGHVRCACARLPTLEYVCHHNPPPPPTTRRAAPLSAGS